jgi:hypothetical protein
MSYRTIATIAAASILCVACVATEAMAYRGGYRAGGVRVGGYGGVYRRRLSWGLCASRCGCSSRWCSSGGPVLQWRLL